MPIGRTATGGAVGPSIRPRLVGEGSPLGGARPPDLPQPNPPTKVEVLPSTDVGTGRMPVKPGQVLPIVEESVNRVYVTIVNDGTVDIYIGDRQVSISNGFRLAVSQSFSTQTSAAIYAIAPAGADGLAQFFAEYQ